MPGPRCETCGAWFGTLSGAKEAHRCPTRWESFWAWVQLYLILGAVFLVAGIALVALVLNLFNIRFVVPVPW